MTGVLLRRLAQAGESDSQRRRGMIVTGVGVLLLVMGVIVLNMVSANVRANVWLRNLTPLVPLAGIVLIGQGLVLWRLRGKKQIAWFLALPGVIFMLVIVIFPTIYSLGLSTIQWDVQVPEQKFVFLQNYATLLSTARVQSALVATIVIAVSAVTLELVLGVGLALLLRDPFPGRSAIISIIIIPMMMAPIVVGQTWRMLWDARFGPVNHILSVIIGEPVHLLWLSDATLAFPAIILTDVWQWTPFVFLITLAGLLAINPELYEVVAIDGASPPQIFWHITLPLLRPVLLVALLFRLMDSLKIFDIVYILTNGGPGYATENYTFYLYQQGIRFGRFGFTAAGSIIFLIIVVIITTILVRRIGERAD
jgi:multiple sugar transport system permease protein